MGLWKVKIDNEIESKVVHSEGSLSLSNISYAFVKKFKYRINEDSLIPIGFLNAQGVKYIMPGWVKCHPKTTINDIDIIKNHKKSPKIEKEVFEVESSSSNKTYKVIKKGDKYTCNCWGYKRLKNKEQGCKHIKQIKS